VTGMFFVPASHRLRYTGAGNSQLFYRYLHAGERRRRSGYLHRERSGRRPYRELSARGNARQWRCTLWAHEGLPLRIVAERGGHTQDVSLSVASVYREE
jgi:hypothetical protein